MSQLMKRRIIVGAIVLNILTVIFPFAANAAGPTLKATRIGQKVVWRGSVYIAVSVKGKIVWKLVGKLGVNSPSSAPSQSPTSSPSASPTISELPKPSVSENTSSAPSNISDPVAPLRPDLGIFVLHSRKLTEGNFAIYPARNSKGQTLDYALSRKNGIVRAFSTECTHAGCAVQVSRDDLWCPCHHSNFDPYVGKVTGGPATESLTNYFVTEVDGFIYIKI